MTPHSSDKLTVVHVRLVFLRIGKTHSITLTFKSRPMISHLGEIDTLNERYQAHASIESRWVVSHDKFLSTITATEQERLMKGKSISLDKYEQSHWHPQLYIENALGDLKEQIKYSAKINAKDQKIYICEHRIIKGMFWEKLELQHFPSDVQDLSISVTSTYFHNRVVLIADPQRQSGVNREAFVDQQEWCLYEHIDTEERYVKEFLFQTSFDDNDDDDDEEEDNCERLKSLNTDDRKRSVLTVTCHVGT